MITADFVYTISIFYSDISTNNIASFYRTCAIAAAGQLECQVDANMIYDISIT